MKERMQRTAPERKIRGFCGTERQEWYVSCKTDKNAHIEQSKINKIGQNDDEKPENHCKSMKITVY